jgi:GH43 family beta-xylosidase
VAATFVNPVIDGAAGEDHGDPFIIKYLDSYFLYHTGDTHGRRGIAVHRSQDLVNWEFQGYALEPADSGWAWTDLWAPEVVYERGTFYMYLSATRKLDADPLDRWQTGEGAESGRRLGVARATEPLGPFVVDELPLVDAWSIDGHPFRDDDGSMWLYYNVRTQDWPGYDGPPGTGTVCDRLVAPDRLAGRPAVVTFPSQRWEANRDGDWYWNEGPYVLKRRGWYHQMYSGGYFEDETYAVGNARARHPAGPWQKLDDNPTFSSSERLRGPGHHSFVFGPDVATRYAVYHARTVADPGRKVALDRQVWHGDGPGIVGPTDGEQPIPFGAVHREEVPHWRAELWARGSWVEIQRQRFELQPRDVWHQVEVVHADGRYAVRIGGALRASRPTGAGTRRPYFDSDGDICCLTVSSTLEDGAIHQLPASSVYVWQWGGAGPVDLELAVDGSVEVGVGGESVRLEGERGAYRFERLRVDPGGGDILLQAGADGAVIADVTAYARP